MQVSQSVCMQLVPAKKDFAQTGQVQSKRVEVIVGKVEDVQLAARV